MHVGRRADQDVPERAIDLVVQDYRLAGDVDRLHDADQLEEIVGDQGFFYISIIIRADGQIVGYGLITLQLSTDPVRTATAVQCTTVSFPAVDGKKQSVSESYVWLQIEQLKKK